MKAPLILEGANWYRGEAVSDCKGFGAGRKTWHDDVSRGALNRSGSLRLVPLHMLHSEQIQRTAASTTV